MLIHGGVQTFQHGPNEETAWHELGHAVDIGALKHITASKEFDEAFHKGLPRLTDRERESLSYYIQSENGSYQAAKEELFAQIFCLKHKPNTSRDEELMLTKFSEVVTVMKEHKSF